MTSQTYILQIRKKVCQTDGGIGGIIVRFCIFFMERRAVFLSAFCVGFLQVGSFKVDGNQCVIHFTATVFNLST